MLRKILGLLRGGGAKPASRRAISESLPPAKPHVPSSEAEALKQAGNKHLAQGDLEDAATAYRQAIAIDSLYADAYNNLGFLLLTQGRFADAKPLLEQAVLLDPGMAVAHHSLAIVLRELGDAPNALQHLNRAVAADPDLIPAYLDLALALAQDGDPPKARQVISSGLARMPNAPDLHAYQGNLYRMENRPDEAIACYREALAHKPDFAEAHVNIATLLQSQNQLDQAIAHCRDAISLRPNFIEALYVLATSLQAQSKHDAAIAAFQQILSINPNLPEVHGGLGNSHRSLNALDKAIQCYRAALAISPGFAEIQTNLGITLASTGELDEAMELFNSILSTSPASPKVLVALGGALHLSGALNDAANTLRKAIGLNPSDPEAHNLLGNALLAQGRMDEAIASYSVALVFKPDFADAHYNRGIALGEKNLQQEAIANFRKALDYREDYAEAHTNLGNALLSMEKMEESILCFQKALAIDPDLVEAYNGLGLAHQKQGKAGEAIRYYQTALALKPHFHPTRSNLIFLLDLMSEADIPALQAERRRWDEIHAAPLLQHIPFANSRDPDRPLRIGYVSADFREHSACTVFAAMLVQFDSARFSVFAYSNSTSVDDRTRLLQQRVTQWRNIAALSDDTVADLIRSDQIDILVDLSGHSAGNRLLVFARKPAPIQITAWGYATSTGLSAIDVFFADPVIVPPEEQHFYTETVRYLPNVVSYFQPQAFPPVNPLPALDSGQITFGSFNRIPKISPAAFKVWAQVISAVPNSRMILKTVELDDAATRSHVLGFFTSSGIPAERISLLGKTSWSDHMAAFNQVDIALDPFPHSGGVSAIEGLIMGIPCVALRWPTIAGRLSASFLTTLGLTDWIAETETEYIAIATAKAQNMASLSDLRANLRQCFENSIIGNTSAYARAVELEYRKLWQKWRSRQSAVSLTL